MADPTRLARLPDRLVLPVICAAGVAVAAMMFLGHWQDPGALWRDPYHDRNTHYRFAVDLVLALCAGDLPDLLVHILQSTTWPPLHGLLLSLILLPAGPDQRFAILPSLIGWVATIVLSARIARRLFTERWPGNVAACVAAALVIASPAFRLLGSDVMLEGLGSGLTAFVVYAAMRVGARPKATRWWRLLAIGLTLLFLEKYNYWLVALAALGLSAPRAAWAGLVAAISPAAAGLRGLGWRQVLGIAGAAGLFVVAIAAIVQLDGPSTLTLFGRPFALFPPGHLVSIAAALLLLQLAVLSRSWPSGNRLSDGIRLLLRWHAAPVAAWFLLPQMLYVFLWFVGPTHFGASRSYDPAAAVWRQWLGFAGGFHAANWLGVAVLLAALPGLWQSLRDHQGGRVVAALAMLATAAVVLHPQQQWRFQATWLFAIWVCAGAGVAMLAQAASRVIGPLAGAGVAAVAIATPLIAALALPLPPLANDVAIRRPSAPRDLDLAAAYLPLLRGERAAGFAAGFGKSDLFAWTLQEQCDCRVRVEQPDIAFAESREQIVGTVTGFLDAAPVDRLAFIAALPPYAIPALAYAPDALDGVRDAFHAPTGFVLEASADVPAYPARIEIWRRTQPPPSRPYRRYLVELLLAAIAAAIVVTFCRRRG